MEVFVSRLGCWTHDHGVVKFHTKPPKPTTLRQEMRVFGNLEAASYILELVQTHRVLIASPRHALKALQKGMDRNVVLRLCKQAWVPRSTGGWHVVDPADVSHLMLAVQRKPFTEYLGTTAFDAHPLADFFSFIQRTNPVDPQEFTNLVAEIIDPRWFIDPVRPHRRSAYLSFLGVCPSVLAGADQSKRAQRCGLLLRTLLSGPGFLAADFAKTSNPRERLRAAKRAAVLLQDCWMAALSYHPEVSAIGPLLEPFGEREYLRQQWQEATAG